MKITNYHRVFTKNRVKFIVLMMMLSSNALLFNEVWTQTASSPLSVYDLSQLSSRQIEEAGTFYLRGIVGKSVHIGFIKGFMLKDFIDEECQVAITTEKSSLPETGDTIVLKVAFNFEWRLNNHVLLVLIEKKE